jgi:hypothetical protein
MAELQLLIMLLHIIHHIASSQIHQTQTKVSSCSVSQSSVGIIIVALYFALREI